MKGTSFDSSTPISDKRKWCEDVVSTLMEFSNKIETLLPNVTHDKRIALQDERDKTCDYYKALLLMWCYPELELKFKLEFIGRTIVTSKEVENIIVTHSDLSDPTHNQSKQNRSTPRKKKNRKKYNKNTSRRSTSGECDAISEREELEGTDEEWIIRSSCKQHMTGNIDLFDETNLKRVTKSKVLVNL